MSNVYLSNGNIFGDVLDCSAQNLMNINVTKTKEMIVGVNVNLPPPLVWSDETIERVGLLCYKLLGVWMWN